MESPESAETAGEVRSPGETYRKDGPLPPSVEQQPVQDEGLEPGEERLIALETMLLEQARRLEELAGRLNRGEARLAAYVNQGLVGMCVTSPAKGWLEVNDRLVTMLGYARNEFLERTWAELTHPDDLDADVAQFERLLRGEIENYEIEKRFIRKDGAVLHAYMAVGCHRAADLRVTELFSVIVDLTQVKRAESARDFANRRVRQILDSSEAAVLAVDSQGRIIECNRRATDLFGWSREQLIGRVAGELVVASGSSLAYRGILSRAGLGSAERNEVKPAKLFGRRRTETGGGEAGGVGEFPMELKLTPLPTEGAPEFSLSIIDLSERMRVEEELRTYANRLKQSNSDLEQFAYVASHDLQEPPRAVTGFCQLLELDYGDRLDDEGRKYIAKAVAGTERMRQLISDLLDYSRVTRHGVEFEPHDLTQAAEEARSLWERRLREVGGTLEIAPLPTLRVDRGQFVRVFQNLFGNAIKYRAATPLRIEVTTQEFPGEWKITIRDNGIGISPEFHQRIFVIFQRLHTRSEHEGTGIGLAICHRIIQRHGGQIWVESEEGQGSAFQITLPKSI